MQSLRDKQAKFNISVRLRRLETGNWGDSKPVGEGVIELRVHIGAGYRVYCGQHGQELVLLLCGGDKDSQMKDILKAKEYWTEWKRRQS
jgi:putative addiction module killer protein